MNQTSQTHFNIKNYKGWSFCTTNEQADKSIIQYIDKYGQLDRILEGNINTKTSNFFQGLVYLKAPDHITKVEPFAFANCSDLAVIELNACYEICDYAFFKCKSLNTVILPNAIAVRSGAFAYAGNMDENAMCLSVFAPKLEIISPLTFFECAVQYLKLSSVQIVKEKAICKCKRLKVLNLPDALKFSSNALKRNENLQQIYAPCAEEIDVSSLKNCPKLELIILDRNGKRMLKKSIIESANNVEFAPNFNVYTLNEYNNKFYNQKLNITPKTKK